MKRIFLALFVLTTLATSAQKSVLLRANYNKGDKYLITLEQNQSMGLQGGVNMTMTMDMTVTDVFKDSIITQAKISRIKMDMMSEDLTLTYDSNMPDSILSASEKMMKTQMEPMLNTTLITTVDKLGKTLGVKVDPANPMMAQFTDNSSSVVFPKEPISVGYKWEMNDENMGMKMNQVFTVTKIENGTVYISISGKVSGMGEGEILGKTEIDIETGVQKLIENSVKVSAMGSEVTVNSKVTAVKQ